MGKLTISHRSTTYPCSVPDLGSLAGAGRIGLTRRKSNKIIVFISKKMKKDEFFLKRTNVILF